MGFFAGVIAAVAAAAVSSYASVKQGEQAEKVGKFNAEMFEREADERRKKAASDAEDAKKRHDRLLAQQRARLAASGVQPGEGSPLLVTMASEEEAALDVARIKYAGRADAANLTAQAKLHRYQGRQAKQQGYLKAGASILGAVGSVAGGRYGG